MKIYAHWDGDQPFTKVIKVADQSTVADLRDACWDALTARHPELAASGPGELRLTGADRRPLTLGSCLGDVLTSGDDVFYQVNSTPPGGQPASTSAGRGSSDASAGGLSGSCAAAGDVAAFNAVGDAPSGASTTSSVTGQGPSRPAAAAAVPSETTGQADGRATSGSQAAVSDPATQAGGEIKLAKASAGRASSNSSSAGAGTGEALAPVVHALWLRAEAAAVQLNYRGAGEVLEQALLLAPEPSSPTHIATLVRLARLWLSAGNPGAAVQWALRAAKQRSHDPGVLELAGDCLREGGRPREAAAQYQSALEALQEAEEEGEAEGEARGSQAPATPGGFGDDADPDEPSSSPPLLRLRLSLAACLMSIPGSITPPYDNQDLAASLVMAVLEREPGHWEALRLYARIALERGLREDAMRVALRLVVARPKHTGAKALLAECLKDEAGCRQLYEELGLRSSDSQPAAAGTAAAAAVGSSSNSSTAAALAFVATAVKDFGKVDTCISLLQRASQLDPANPSYCLNLVHALELHQDMQAALEAGRSYCRTSGSKLAGRPLRDADTLLSSLPELRNPLQLSWYTSEPLWGSPPPQPLQSQPLPAPAQEQVSYSSDQLDELALLFTLAKVLFVGGALTAAARLCELVEPLRSASSVELHTTLVRNEAAYFGCVAQLLKDYPPPPALPPLGALVGVDAAASPGSSTQPLYLVGDSHCLSAAWRLVTLRGEQRLLRPLLVTGCKVWHLRPASEFYPKKQFEATMRMLPDGVQVVLVLGEIDCREGLLLAVQKGKYDSVAKGIDATVTVYMELLRGMVLGRSMEVFLHPVPPVLNETRGVVAPFTAALRAAVAAAREADPALGRRLHYLDFFDQLLVPRQNGSAAWAAATGGAAASASHGSSAGTATAAAVETASGGIGGVRCGGGNAAATAATGSPLLEMVSGQRTVEVVGRGDGGFSGREAGGLLEGDVTVKIAAPAAPAAAATGRALRSDLVFDGTHLAPTYVPLLDAALSQVA